MGPHTPGGPVRWVLRIDASGKGRCRGLGPGTGHMLEMSCRSGHLGRRGLCLPPPQGSYRARGEAAAKEGG